MITNVASSLFTAVLLLANSSMASPEFCKSLDVKAFEEAASQKSKTYASNDGSLRYEFTFYFDKDGLKLPKFKLYRLDKNNSVPKVTTYYVNPIEVEKKFSKIKLFDGCIDSGSDGVVDTGDEKAFSFIQGVNGELFSFNIVRFIEFIDVPNGYLTGTMSASQSKLVSRNLRLDVGVDPQSSGLTVEVVQAVK